MTQITNPETNQTMTLYPEGVTAPEPKYKAGQQVPNWYGTMHTVAGLKYEPECSEEWVPDSPGSEEGKTVYVMEPTEWQYLLVRPGNQIWGWVKESEITKDLSRVA